MRRFPWAFTLLWGVVFVLMISAGIWQLGRGETKRQIQASQQQVSFTTVTDQAMWAKIKPWQKIEFEGRYLDWTFIQDNQVMSGQLGQFVFTVVAATDSTFVVVNRGWIKPGTATRTSETNTLLRGQVGPWPKPGIQLGEQILSDAKTQTVTYMDESVLLPWLTERLCSQPDECQIMPWVLKLDPMNDQGFERDWALPRMTAEKHQAYAIQWFTMAAVLLLVYGIFIRKHYAK